MNRPALLAPRAPSTSQRLDSAFVQKAKVSPWTANGCRRQIVIIRRRLALELRRSDLITGIWRTVLLYALLLGAAAFLLQWVEYRYLVRRFPTEAYIIVIALLFTAVGAWAGNRLSATGNTESFEINQLAITQLGLSDRELEVLRLLADGQTNKEMARKLSLSPNTIKTHLAKLYGKLDANRRTQAVSKARSLSIIP